MLCTLMSQHQSLLRNDYTVPITAMSRKAVVTSLNTRLRHENCSLCKPGLAPRYSSASGARLPHDVLAGTAANSATYTQAKALQRDARSS